MSLVCSFLAHHVDTTMYAVQTTGGEAVKKRTRRKSATMQYSPRDSLQVPEN